MKIDLFKRTGSGWSYITPRDLPPDAAADYEYDGYIRISEWVEVDFPPRAPEQIIPAQLAMLDARKAEEVDRHLDALGQIAEERGKLLALTHSGEAA